MHLSALFAVLSTLAASIQASPIAAPVKERSIITTAVTERGMDVPASVGGYKARRGGFETHSERIQRGLDSSLQRKRFSGSDELSKRAITPPRVIKDPRSSYAATASTYYYHGNCYTDFNSGTSPSGPRFSLSYTDLQDLADQCAAKQDLQAGKGDLTGAFIVTTDTTRLDGINCVTSAYPAGDMGACAGPSEDSSFGYVGYGND